MHSLFSPDACSQQGRLWSTARSLSRYSQAKRGRLRKVQHQPVKKTSFFFFGFSIPQLEITCPVSLIYSLCFHPLPSFLLLLCWFFTYTCKKNYKKKKKKKKKEIQKIITTAPQVRKKTQKIRIVAPTRRIHGAAARQRDGCCRCCCCCCHCCCHCHCANCCCWAFCCSKYARYCCCCSGVYFQYCS